MDGVMTDKNFKAVIFDMDGVLCDSEPFINEAGVEMFRRYYDLTVQPDDFLPFVGAGDDRYVGGVAEKYGFSAELPRDKNRMYDIYLELIKGRLQPLAGVRDFIARCREAGCKVAVATSSDTAKMEGNLREIGLPAETFDACVNGSMIEHKKPAPDIFLAAAGKLGAEAAECLVIEDAVNGVQAALAAGMTALGITSSFPPETLLETGASWTAPDLAGACNLPLF